MGKQQSDKYERAQAHRQRMLASILARIEQCQATAFHYGMADAETALAECLKTLKGGAA